MDAIRDIEKPPTYCLDDNHDFQEGYYGWYCTKCDIFYAFGCEPWLDDYGTSLEENGCDE